jgi:hypothetical protein
VKIVHFCDGWGYRTDVLRSPRIVVAVLGAALLALVVLTVPHAHDEVRPEARLAAYSPGMNSYRVLTSDADFRQGSTLGLSSTGGTLTITGATRPLSYGGRTFQYGAWTSGWVVPGQGFTELIPSWNAITPPGAWLQVQVQVRGSSGATSGFRNLGSWSTRDGVVHRTSADAQPDPVAQVSTDTLLSQRGVTLTGYRFLVRLMRLPGRTGPSLMAIGAVVSRMAVGTPVVSAPLSARPISLPVPSYSQMIHRGQDPQYGGGGEAWCSPTSLSMILGYYHRLPAPADYTWAPYPEAWVNQVARLTYDTAYQGTGNWPFNTAIGAGSVGDGFVTRLPDLRTAERFIRAGIPLALSISFGPGQLTGAPITSTPGHLVVLVGFTSTGRPVINDPAARTDAGVRRSYDRAQFERAWLNGSGGMAYVVHDAAHPLPARPAGTHAW